VDLTAGVGLTTALAVPPVPAHKSPSRAAVPLDLVAVFDDGRIVVSGTRTPILDAGP